MEALSELRERPAGNLRITTAEHAANTIIWPALATFLPAFPDISVEVSVNYGFVDIVAERFDSGVRLGEQVAKDMTAVRIGPEMRIAVVAAPSYFATRRRPQLPQDLTAHNCINLRLPTHGSLAIWDFEKNGREVRVRVEGQVVAGSVSQILFAALAGMGLAWIPEDVVLSHIERGALVRVLEKWCAPFQGYYLYYPNRREGSPALAMMMGARSAAPASGC